MIEKGTVRWHRADVMLCPKAEDRANGFGAESVVLRPEGVYTYTERKETAVE